MSSEVRDFIIAKSLHLSLPVSWQEEEEDLYGMTISPPRVDGESLRIRVSTILVDAPGTVPMEIKVLENESIERRCPILSHRMSYAMLKFDVFGKEDDVDIVVKYWLVTFSVTPRQCYLANLSYSMVRSSYEGGQYSEDISMLDVEIERAFFIS